MKLEVGLCIPQEQMWYIILTFAWKTGKSKSNTLTFAFAVYDIISNTVFRLDVEFNRSNCILVAVCFVSSFNSFYEIIDSGVLAAELDNSVYSCFLSLGFCGSCCFCFCFGRLCCSWIFLWFINCWYLIASLDWFKGFKVLIWEKEFWLE